MAGSIAKRVCGWALDTATRKAAAQYGYRPETSRHRAVGPGSHYVYPDVFGAGSGNGLVLGAGVALGAGLTIFSEPLDLSGWQRWTAFFQFPGALPVGGATLFVQSFSDPAFANLAGQSAGNVIAAGTVTTTFDSQLNATAASYMFTPYVKLVLVSAAALGASVTCSVFGFSYMNK